MVGGKQQLGLLLLALLLGWTPNYLIAESAPSPSPLVASLIKSLTLKQKVGQMTQLSASMLIGKDNHLDPVKAEQILGECTVSARYCPIRGEAVSTQPHRPRA